MFWTSHAGADSTQPSPLRRRHEPCFAHVPVPSSTLKRNRDNHGAGGVAEWLKAAVLKTVDAQAFVGSNPTPSASSPLDRYGGGDLVVEPATGLIALVAHAADHDQG
jgi:hypothetical protein